MAFDRNARAFRDPDWNPTLFEATQYNSPSVAIRHNTQFSTTSSDAVGESLVVTLAVIAPPTTFHEVSNVTEQPNCYQNFNATIPDTMPFFIESRMPQIRGRLRVMESALDNDLAHESGAIRETKSYITEVLGDDAHQLLLRGVLVDGAEEVDKKKMYWMDSWNERFFDKMETQYLKDALEREIMAAAGQHHRAQYTETVDNPYNRQARPLSQQLVFAAYSKIVDQNGNPYGLPGGTASIPHAYRTYRRRVLLRTLYIQRRALSDRLDQIEQELEKYGAMRNMDQAWKSPPAFVCPVLDATISALRVKISEGCAYMFGGQRFVGDKCEPNESSDPVKQEDVSMCSTRSGNTNGDGHTSLSRQTDQLLRQSAYTEARALALANAVALPSPEEAHGGEGSVIVSNDGLLHSETASTASATSADDPRQPSMTTISTIVASTKNTNKSIELGSLEPVATPNTTPVAFDGSLQPVGGYHANASSCAASSTQPANEGCSGHQSHSSISTLTSIETDSSGRFSSMATIPGSTLQMIQTQVGIANGTYNGNKCVPKPTNDQETCLLLNFRRELLRELHLWNHIEGCLFSRIDAIHNEHARLQRYISLLRVTSLDRQPSDGTSLSAAATRQDAGNLLARQRARARELGCPAGVIVVDPDTPINAGAFVMVPPPPKSGFVSQ